MPYPHFFSIKKTGNVLYTAVIIWALFAFQSFIHLAYATAPLSDSAQYDELNTLSAAELLDTANQLRFSDKRKSLALANVALRKSKQNQDRVLEATIHSLLGWLSHELQNNNDAKLHYLRASHLFSELNNTKQHILNNFEYIELLFLEDNHDIAYKRLGKLLQTAVDFGDLSLASQVIMLKANSLYYEKRYNEAEKVFLTALEFLIAQDTATQTNRGEAFHQLGQIFKHLKDYKKSGEFHQQALHVHEQLEEPSLIARSLKNIAIALYKQGELIKALDHIIRGLKVQEQIYEPSKRAELLVLAGSTYRQLNRYETSLEYLDKALNMYEDMDDTSKIAESLNQMGLLYNRLNKRKEARALHERVIQLPSDQVEGKTLAATYREIAVHEKKAGNYEYAMQMVNKAHNIFMAVNDTAKATITARIIGEIYQAQGNIQEALNNYENALTLAEQNGSVKNQVKILNKLGFAVIKDDVDAAYHIFQRSLSLLKNKEYLSEKATVLRELMKIERAKGNYKLSLRHAEDLLSLTKTISKKREQDKVAVAKATIESHIMETELITLREKVKIDQLSLAKKNNEIEIAKQANQISELELVKNRYANFLLVALLVFCIGSIVYIYRIFAASRTKNKELDYLATHDPLTNCLNRRGLFNIIEPSFAEGLPEQDYCIVMADIDRFKYINDTYGHDAGDEVLVEIVKALQQSISTTDHLARYGGEEFCVALPHSSLEQALEIAESIRINIEAKPINGIAITCSFGIANADAEANTPSKLISRADKALYYSKENGRNQVNVWDKSLSAID